MGNYNTADYDYGVCSNRLKNPKKVGEVQKVLLLGEPNSGKKEVFKNILSKDTNWGRATLAVDYVSMDFTHSGKTVDAKVWDSSGKERNSKTKMGSDLSFFKGADVCVLFFSLTDRKTFSKLGYWLLEVLKDIDVETSVFPQILLIGTYHYTYCWQGDFQKKNTMDSILDQTLQMKNDNKFRKAIHYEEICLCDTTSISRFFRKLGKVVIDRHKSMKSLSGENKRCDGDQALLVMLVREICECWRKKTIGDSDVWKLVLECVLRDEYKKEKEEMRKMS